MGRKKKYTQSIPGLQNIWKQIKERCYNPKHPSFEYYGAKGVVVCKEWMDDYQSFLNWALTNGWKKGLQIDKDTIGDGKLYSPETCCFITAKKNSNTKSNNIYVEWEGVIMTVAEVCELEGFNNFRIYSRMKKGMSFEAALKTPVRKRGPSSLVEFMGEKLTFKEISRRTGAYYPRLVHNFRRKQLSILESIKQSTNAA